MIRQGQMKTDVSSFDLTQAINEVVDIFKKPLESQSINFEVSVNNLNKIQYNSTDTVMVTSEKHRIQRTLFNCLQYISERLQKNSNCNNVMNGGAEPRVLHIDAIIKRLKGEKCKLKMIVQDINDGGHFA